MKGIEGLVKHIGHAYIIWISVTVILIILACEGIGIDGFIGLSHGKFSNLSEIRAGRKQTALAAEPI